MPKQIAISTITLCFDDMFEDKTIEQVRQRLSEIEKEYITPEVTMHYFIYDVEYNGRDDLLLYRFKEESPEEEAHRLQFEKAEHNRRRIAYEQREREQYEKLKKKFGGE